MPDWSFWLHLPGRRWWMLLEAALGLTAARLALAVVPFRHLTWLFERRAAWAEVTGMERARLKSEVRWAVKTVSRWLPERFVCFPRAIAAQAMLRRRGVSTTLYYGASRQPEMGIITHVWIQDGDEGVIGSLAARGHKVLARYPAR
jgi:hypothetical protein